MHFLGQTATFLLVQSWLDQVVANEMLEIHLCHFIHCAESALSGHRVFLKVSSKYYTLEGILSQRLIQQVEQEGKWEIYRVLSLLEGALLMDKRMIMQVSLCSLSFQRMNLSLSTVKLSLYSLVIHSVVHNRGFLSQHAFEWFYLLSKYFPICLLICSAFSDYKYKSLNKLVNSIN